MYRETKWTVIDTEETMNAALELCRGTYQTDVIKGRESWSGSTLRGLAKQYSARYAQSRGALRQRLEAAGLHVQIQRVDRRNVLFIALIAPKANQKQCVR